MSIISLNDKILACVQDPNHWEDALDEFAVYFDLFSACVFTIHDFEKMRTGLYLSEGLKGKFDLNLKKKIESGNDKDDHASYAKLMLREPLVPHDELSVMGVNSREELPPSDIRAGAEAIGIKMRVPTVLNRSGPWLDGLFAHTKRDNDHLSYMKNPEVLGLMSVMSNAVMLSRIFEGLRSRYMATLSALDKLGLGVFVLDSRGQVIEKNAAALDIIDQSDGIFATSRGGIKLADDASDAEFQDAFAEGLLELNGMRKRTRGMLAVPRLSGQYDYLLSIRPLLDSTGEMQSGFQGFFVTVIDPERKGVLSADGIAALGNLTSAEKEISKALVEGLKTADIADRRNVSRDTVRVQIKSLLAKLRCTSQSEVIRIAAATRLPFCD